MQDLLGMMDQLRRPPLLIRAAREGVMHYNRTTHLQRVLGYGQIPRTGDALLRLMQDEAILNEQRKSGDAGYSAPRHVDVLIAMLGETQVLRASQLSRARNG